jgi:hypothetical protein
MLLFTAGLLSCTEPYDPDIDRGQQVLVIDGFLNNHTGNNHVVLSMANPYDSAGIPKRIRNARVFITDNDRRVSLYKEITPGYYIPVDASFTGEVNRTYTLTVETPDGQVYESEPEVLMPPLIPEKVSGGYNTAEKLVGNYYGDISKTAEDICEIYYDFESDNAEIPRFRFTSSQITEYLIYKELIPPTDAKASILFYCWMTKDDNSLRFTNEKYRSNAVEVKNQTVCVTAPDGRISVPDMDTNAMDYADTYITTYEHKRIVRINQYRLNPDAYTYYKGIEKQSAGEGKMFDPLTSQLYGNIICKTTPDQMVLGFFEASSVSTHSWTVTPYGKGNPVKIESVPDIYPPSYGFTIDSIPGFWIW